MLWAAGATSCLVAALALAPHRVAFAVGAVLTAALMLDDLFLLHEEYYPRVGVPEGATPAVYACAVVAYVVAFRGFLSMHGLLMLPLAFGFFAISASLDAALEEASPFLVEDGAKLAGIATWTAVFLTAAVTELRPRQGASPSIQ